jgi:hypothetical protein
LFIETTQVDPFDSNLTVAGLCNTVFRKHFLRENTIGIVPHQGYSRIDRQSVVGAKYMQWIAHRDGIRVQHAYNGGEKQIGNYKVDGFCEETNTCYEFNGCL